MTCTAVGPGSTRTSCGCAGSASTVGLTTHEVAGATAPAVAASSVCSPVPRNAATNGTPASDVTSTDEGPTEMIG